MELRQNVIQLVLHIAVQTWEFVEALPPFVIALNVSIIELFSRMVAQSYFNMFTYYSWSILLKVEYLV